MKYLLRKALSWFLLFIIGLNSFGKGTSDYKEGYLRPPVLRHRTLVPYVPLREQLSENGPGLESLIPFSKASVIEKCNIRESQSIVLLQISEKPCTTVFRREESFTYTYDALNRLSKVKDELGTIEYEYDANGNVLTVSEKEGILGQKKSIVRTYDNLNRVTSYTDYKGREVKYGYDSLGNLKTLIYPGGEIVTYTYNPDGNIAAMSSKSGGTFTYGYDNYGRLCKISRADGSTETRTYDTAGQLTEQVDRDKNGDILQKNIYTYDVFGEITEKTTSSEGDISKLVSVSMEYDAANRLVKYDGKEVTYDSRGNMTYGPVDGEMQELTYDVRNRLVRAGSVSYAYDCENTRTATTEGGITTEYVTDLSGTLSRMLIAYENVGTAGASETHYYYGAEGLACQNNNTSGKYFSYHYDNIGSTTLITDKTGRKVEEFAYGTYGELLTEVVNNIRFLYNGSYGVMTDSNGLYYMRARYYNPDIKRFINQDIKVGDISNGQGLNRYAYCEGNPISMTDPFGLCGENANDQGEKSRFDKWHTALDVVGLFWDGADVINAGLYLLEEKRGQALLCIACALPAVGMAVAGVAKSAKAVIKARRAEKMLSFVADVGAEVKTASKAADTVGEVMEAAGKYGKEAIKYGDSIIEEGGATALKLLEKGGDAVQEAKATVKEVEAVTSAGGLRLATKADEVIDYGKYSTKIDSKVTVVKKRKLDDWLVDTFKDGKYRTVITNEDITVYRSFGYNAEAGGAFATSTSAISRLQTKIDSAILPEWKNTLRYEAEIVVPKGTILEIGKVGEQYTMSGAKLAGGADQFLLPQNWDLNWIKHIKEVKP